MNDRRTVSDSASSPGISRDDVRDYYAKAAVATQESLCCPVKYDPTDLSHIPKEVLSISYGCGSPVNRASLKAGETLVDLGSGGGIDCFIAARITGPEGRVIGIDMTDEMLARARRNAQQVAENLGYANVEFRQGFLETLPVEDNTADVVTSNCVVNLSTEKQEVFREIHRILKPGGRFVIADIISDRPVPEAMRQDRELWGECISGALTLEEFLGYAGQSDFYGFQVTKDYLWKEVEGIRFYSYILEGFKRPAADPAAEGKTCTAIYVGPFEKIVCEGREFRVGIPVEVDAATARRLGMRPYCGEFNLIDPDNESPESPSDSCCG